MNTNQVIKDIKENNLNDISLLNKKSLIKIKKDRYISNTLNNNSKNLKMNIGNKNIKTNKNLSINFNEEMKNLSRKPEKKRYLEKNEKTRLLTYDFIPESTYNKLTEEDNLKYNNLAYKEIKYENKYEGSSNSIYSRKNKSLKNIHFSQNSKK